MFQGHADPRPTEQEVTEALTNPEREEGPSPTRVHYFNVVGETASGRSVFVAWVDRPDGRYPLHSHYTGRRAQRRQENG